MGSVGWNTISIFGEGKGGIYFDGMMIDVADRQKGERVG